MIILSQPSNSNSTSTDASTQVGSRAALAPSFLLQAAALVVVVWGLANARSFFVPLMLAALLAFAISPAVRLLRRWGVGEGIALALAALVVVAPMVGVIALTISEVQTLVSDWPRLSQNLLTAVAHLRDEPWVQRLHLDAYLDPTRLKDVLGDYAGSGVTAMLGGLLHVLSAGTTLLLIIFFSIVMLASRKHLGKAAAQCVEAYHGGSPDLVTDIADLIQIFLTARFGLTALTGVAGWLVMMFMGVHYAFVAGMFYGLMTWVPAVGLIFALIPPLALSVASGATSGHTALLLGLLLLVWGVQDHLLAPKWLGGRLKLNFLATYFALFVGERLWGAWGMFLSVPTLAVMRIIFAASPGMRPLAFLFSAEEPPVPVAEPGPNHEIEAKARELGLPAPEKPAAAHPAPDGALPVPVAEGSETVPPPDSAGPGITQR